MKRIYFTPDKQQVMYTIEEPLQNGEKFLVLIKRGEKENRIEFDTKEKAENFMLNRAIMLLKFGLIDSFTMEKE